MVPGQHDAAHRDIDDARPDTGSRMTRSARACASPAGTEATRMR